MQFLEVPFSQKDAVKSLGGRWDPLSKKWYIPEGLDSKPFAPWLPDNKAPLLSPPENSLGLAQLLAQVQSKLQQEFAQAIWLRAEIAAISGRNHLYLDLVESDISGQPVAQARGMIWAMDVARLEQKFFDATQTPLAAGQRVLILVQLRFDVKFGLSFSVQDIDPSYTLGDIQRQLELLRQRLIAQGLYDMNRRLSLPQDFFRVAVIAPEKAAGLGDFMADAQALAAWNLCEFEVFYATFQGVHTQESLLAALQQVHKAHGQNPFDVLVMIRGGGAQMDLHALNQEAIAQAVAQCALPVFTGIGHERDSTILDEVAALAFDTPSKVIAAIRQAIFSQAQAAQGNFQKVMHIAEQLCQRGRLQLQHQWYAIAQQSQQRLHQQKQHLHQQHGELLWFAESHLQRQKHQCDKFLERTQHYAKTRRVSAQQELEFLHGRILERVKMGVEKAQNQLQPLPGLVRKGAEFQLFQQKIQCQTYAQWLQMRHPQHLLSQGYTYITDSLGFPLSHLAAAMEQQRIKIHFMDGVLEAEPKVARKNRGSQD